MAACIAFALAQTLVVPGAARLAEEYDASQSAVSWVLTGFLLSASIATPIAGKLGDLYGKGRILTAILVLFSVGAVINALAPTIEVLIAGRVLQGVAGGVFPLAFGIIRDTFPRDTGRRRAGIISAVFGIGGGIGLPLSGVIVDNLDLAWLFWISLFSVPAAVAAHRLIPPSPPVEQRAGGLARGGAALGRPGGDPARRLAVRPAGAGARRRRSDCIAAGVALIGAFLFAEGRVNQPLIDLEVLRKPSVAATNLTGFLVGLAMFASFLIFPQFAQAPESTGYGFGLSVTAAGLVMMPTALAQLAAGPIAAKLAERFGFRAMLSFGTVLITLSFLINTFAHAHVWELVVRRHPDRRRDHVRVRGQREPDRRGGAAGRGRDRDRHQHRDADRRRLVRRRRGHRDPDREHDPADRERLHDGVRVLARSPACWR